MFVLDPRRYSPHGMAAVESQEMTAEQKQRDVFEAHRHRVFSLSYYMTSDEMEAEQMLAGTFVRAFHSTPLPDAEEVDRALLREIEKRFALEAEIPAVAEGPGSIHGQVRRTDLEEAVSFLPSRERLVFLLKDVEGYAPSRIGSLLGCDEVEVYRVLLSARIRLRNVLRQLRDKYLSAADAEAPTHDALLGA